MMSVTSSTTPGMVEISCSTPWILTRVTALPSKLESSRRRRLLPTVMPKPRSNGSAMNLPCVSVSVARSATTRLGSSKPRQRIRMGPSKTRKKDDGADERNLLLHPLALHPSGNSARDNFNNQLFADLLDARIDVAAGRQAGHARLRRLGADHFHALRNLRRHVLHIE